jgi:hypothetical protein
MKIKLQIRDKLFISHFLAVFLVSGSIGTYFYTSAMDSLIGREMSERLNLDGRRL